MADKSAGKTAIFAGTPVGDLSSYLLDTWQRQLLFLDVLRQRGNQYHEQIARDAPSVLTFETVQVVDGSKLPRSGSRASPQRFWFSSRGKSSATLVPFTSQRGDPTTSVFAQALMESTSSPSGEEASEPTE